METVVTPEPNRKMAPMRKNLLLIASLGATAYLGLAFASHQYRYRNCINELGDCYDTSGWMVHVTQSGVIWLALAALTLSYAFYLMWPRKS